MSRLTGIVLREKGKELFQVILAVLVIEVYYECDWSQRKYLHLPRLTVYLQVSDE